MLASLVFLTWVLLLDAPTAPRALAAGVAFAATAYSDYYYFVYAVFFAVLWWSAAATNPTLAWRSGRFRRTSRALLVAAGLALAAGMSILMTSGARFDFGQLHVSASRARNPVSVAGLCLLAWALLHLSVVVRRRRHGTFEQFDGDAEAGASGDALDAAPRAGRRQLACVGLAAAVGTALILPLTMGAVSLVRSGDYVSQQYFWRSAPRGIDVATTMLGNPMHAITGAVTRDAYERLNASSGSGGAFSTEL